MNEFLINVKLDEGAILPTYAHYEDACMDIYSNSELVLHPGERGVVSTGLHFEIPVGYEMQIRSRSGLAAKKGICVLNAPGIVDAGYTGDVGVILANLGEEAFEIKKGDKIAQMIVLPIIKTTLNIVDKLDETQRGSNGFGSTGV